MSGVRPAILQAARQLAYERGWKAVTVRAVAARAEVAVGTLRHHFPTQAELHETLARALVDDWRLDVSAIEPDAPAEEALLAFVRAIVPLKETDRAALVAWLVRHASALGPAEDVWNQTTLGREYGDVRTDLRIVLGWFKRAGRLRTDLSIDDVSTFVLALAVGLRLLLLADDVGVNDDTVDRIVLHAARQVVLT
ncbi:TetR/AcrR family transcriptional regulator [Mumia zhuanghuii]|uniref:TetR/AcrR family transcriptional regulator n=2 Tax=Mumia TaxID=1546255 RepID=A0ABW1QPV3_9ACTN|nr:MULTISPECIES: TetR/AcrR family transcriptional regulator [Mumia]KAA1420659.1 TetR/AcrR family transcriptional regulator [Mumia zhuanghuii]